MNNDKSKAPKVLDIWPDAVPTSDYHYLVNGYDLPDYGETIYNDASYVDFINNTPYEKAKPYIPRFMDGTAAPRYARELMNDANYDKFLKKVGVADPYKQYETKFKIGNYEYTLPELAQVYLYGRVGDEIGLQDIYSYKFQDFLKEENDARSKVFKKGGRLPNSIVDGWKDALDSLSNEGLLTYHIDTNGDAVIDKVSKDIGDYIYLNNDDKDVYQRELGIDDADDGKEIEFLKKFVKDAIEDKVENNPEEIINDNSLPQSLKDEAQQIVNNNDNRDDEVNNANVEEALRKTIPGTEILNKAQPKGLLGAGMLYSRDNNIPKPSEERPLDANSLEQITESNPEAVQEALPDTPIAEEARQITDDSDARNDEVNNEAAEETIGMGWNNGLVHDDYDPRVEANNEYEYQKGVGNPGVITERDEDFAGPDELPATIDQIRDEDFVGPDEQLSIYNGGVPEGIYTEPVYDTSDYNFDWDYDIQTLGVKSPEEIPDAPVHNKEQAIAKQRLMKWLKSHGRGYRMSEPNIDMSSREEITNNYRGSGRAAGSSLLGNIGRHSGLSYDVPSFRPLSKEDKHGGPSRSTASGSVELPNSEKPTERTISLSTINSGETMFGKSGMLGRSDLNKGGEIKVGQSGIKAGFTGHTSVPEELAPKPMSGANGSNGIYTDLITQILREFPNGYSDNQITITVNGQNVLVNGKQLGQLSDIEINTLKEIL